MQWVFWYTLDAIIDVSLVTVRDVIQFRYNFCITRLAIVNEIGEQHVPPNFCGSLSSTEYGRLLRYYPQASYGLMKWGNP